MDLDTLQHALKAVFYSLGGNADDVRLTNDINVILGKVAALAIGSAIKAAKELPALPDDDGTYSLQLVMDDGEATLTWEAVES